MNKILILAVMLGLTTLSACKKNDGTVVEFDSPVADQEYKSPVNMVVRFSNAAVGIEFIKIRVYRKANPTLNVYEYSKELNTKEHAIGEQFDVDVTQRTQMIVEYETGQKIQVKGAHSFYVIP